MDVVRNVRGRFAPSDFGATVVNELRRRVQLAHQAMAGSPNLDRHAGALNLLADQIASMDVENPVLMGLSEGYRANGNSMGTPYVAHPGTEQGKVLALVGVDGPAPGPEALAAELMSAAFEDAVKVMRQQVQDAVQQAQAALAERDRVAPFEPRALAAEAALIDAQAAARIYGEERDQLQRQVDYLRAQQHPERDEDGPQAGTQEPTGETGIYWRQRAGGSKVLKVTWPNPEKPGRSLSHLMPDDATLEDAKAYRAERIAETEPVPA